MHGGIRSQVGRRKNVLFYEVDPNVWVCVAERFKFQRKMLTAIPLVAIKWCC